MANKPGEANFFPDVPQFPSMGTFQPVYGKFDLTTYIQGASDYEIMAFLVGKYNACLEAYGNITKLSTDTITACKQLQDWINSWFTNLDVQEEINKKLDSMVADGSFGTLLHQTFDTQINQQTTSAVTAWLVANVTPTGSAVAVDKSLSIEGAAADAKVTGDKCKYLQNIIGNYNKNVFTSTNELEYINIPLGAYKAGDIIEFELSEYSGSKLERYRIILYKESNNESMSSINAYALGTNIVFTVPEDAKNGYLQIIRTETENPVSCEYVFTSYSKYDRSVYSDAMNRINASNATNEAEIKSITKTLGNFTFKTASIGETTSIAENWNLALGEYKAGDTIEFELSKYSGNKLSRYRILLYKTSDGSAMSSNFATELGTNIVFTVPEDAKNGYLQIIRTEAENPVSCEYVFTSYSKYDRSVYSDAMNRINSITKNKIYKVEKDGTGDFAKLSDAINTCTHDMDSIVYVGNGTWDLIAELGDEYLNTISSTNRGLILKNRIHLIFASNAIVTCNYTGDRALTKEWLSPFNAGPYGFTLENCNLHSETTRYCVHDERNSETDFYINKYINCNFYNDNRNGGYEKGIFEILPEGCLESLPKQRSFRLEFIKILPANTEVFLDGERIETENSYNQETQTLTVTLPETGRAGRIQVRFLEPLRMAENDVTAQCGRILYQAEMEYEKKTRIYRYLQEGKASLLLAGMLETMGLEEEILGALKEVLTAQ